MRIFLSYASEDKATADKIYLSLVKRHKVFFDHTELKGGHDFDDKIRDEIKRCELFIFLISPNSIEKSSYALTELSFAREKWSHPEGHVLPVMIRETGYDAIPPYLSAVTILEPQGNVVAEVRARVEAWHESEEKPGIGKNIALGAGALLVLALIVFIVIKFSGGSGANNNNQPNINNSVTPQNTTTQTPVKNTSPANGQTNNSPVNNQRTPNRNFRIPIRNIKIKNANERSIVNN